ncbi:MAG: cytidylate kinase [Flavobacteriales bacterium]|nr:cytidylate kinase [Flavobacteriales bacterium]|tara:strand:+ start:2252 stop:2929 length:678 start_codon:yes stop_codon:yes gene_type:complete
MRIINIAVDGYSSSGKSTLAKSLALKLGYKYIDTGAMYRAVTLFSIQNNLIENDYVKVNSLINTLENINIEVYFKSNLSEIILNGKNITKDIRSMEVSNHVSNISKIKEVRYKLVKQQQLLSKDKGFVIDGRDIGSVVLPDAELKFFIDASLNERIRRRFNELKRKDEKTTFIKVEQNIKKRDITDEYRENSPLIRTTDSIYIDNTNLSKSDQLELALKFYKMIV